MIKDALIAISLFANLGMPSVSAIPDTSYVKERQEKILTVREIDLTTRMPNKYGNQIFADNILLALHYLKDDVESLKAKNTIKNPNDINWEKVREPFSFSMVLKPDEVFAYHKTVLPEFENKVSYTMNSRFYIEEGYKSFNGLGGNGVCHLATLINWAAKEANLATTSYINHDFSPVPEIPREYGVSILYRPTGINSQRQNLYIRNNFEVPVKFEYKITDKKIVLTISK